MIQLIYYDYLKKFNFIRETKKFETNEDIVKECMIIQGGLETILSTLPNEKLEVQLDLINTIVTLISNNVKNKIEFM